MLVLAGGWREQRAQRTSTTPQKCARKGQDSIAEPITCAVTVSDYGALRLDPDSPCAKALGTLFANAAEPAPTEAPPATPDVVEVAAVEAAGGPSYELRVRTR